MTRKKGLMGFDMAKDLLDQIADMELTDVINFYHMGESLLHPKALDIFDHAQKRGLKVKLNTNGSRLTPEMRKALLQLDVDRIHISYHSSYVKFDKYAKKKSPISFEKWHNQILSMVEDRYKYNSKSHIVVILFKSAKAMKDEQTRDVRVLDSHGEVEDALTVWLDLGKRLSKEYGLPYLYDQDTRSFVKKIAHSFVDRADKMFPVLPGFSLNLIKVHTWNNDMVDQKTEKELKFKKAQFGSCDALRDSMAIFADGSYSLCCADWDGNVVVGSAHDTKLKPFLDSPTACNIRKSFEKGVLPFEYCKECRGGYTTKTWAFNQVHSYIYYNSGTYRRLRQLLNMY